MILVDSNIPMYLIGAEHPNKEAARRLLERSIAEGDRLVTDVEVFQEIMHRYVAIDRRDAIQPAFDALLGIVDEIFAIEMSDVEAAKSILLGQEPFSARDAIHVAVMRRREVASVMSFDRGFDRLTGVVRLGG